MSKLTFIEITNKTMSEVTTTLMQQPVLYAMAALALCFGCCQAALKLAHDECAVLRTSAQSVVTRQYDTIGVRAVFLHPSTSFL